MKIIVLASVFVSKGKIRPNLVEYDQAKALKNLGHEVVLLGIDRRSILNRRPLGYFKDEQDSIPIFISSIPLGPTKAFPWWFYMGVSRMATFYCAKKIIREFGSPDIIHAHFMFMGAMAAFLKRKLGIPYVLTEHSSVLAQEQLDRETIKCAKLAYNNADGLIAVSSFLADRIRHHFNIESKVIPNMVDYESFKDLSITNKPSESSQFKFISVGGLQRIKRFELLIDAFSQAALPSNVSLSIVGPGPDEQILKQKVKDLKLTHSVNIISKWHSRAEIYRLFFDSDAFVLASGTETFGLVYIEAMLCRLPIIATDCGGPRDIVNSENGLLIPKESVSDLTNALIWMREHRDQFDGERIQLQCIEKYSPHIIGDQIAHYFETVLKNRKIAQS